MDVVIYTEGLAFDGATPFERSLGGSESAVVFMARELARRDHQVRVFCRCEDPGEYDGVSYADMGEFARFVEAGQCDVFVCCRHLGGLMAPVRSKVRVLWNHDVLVKSAAKHVMSLMYKVDRIMVLSNFHKEQFQRHLEVPDDRYVVTRNGVDLDLVEGEIKGVERDGNRVIYMSRPERGLDVLLQMWPEMKRRRPDLTLAVSFYENSQADPQMADYLASLRQTMEKLPGIEWLGHLSKGDLYREIARSALLVYPSTFPEVSCIGALEAAACGTPVVASRYCALKETVVDGETGLLVSGDPHSDGYRERFVDAAVGLLEEEERWGKMSAAARRRVERRYQWRDVAEEWEGIFEQAMDGAGLRRTEEGGAQVCPSRDGDGCFRRQTVSVCMIVKDAQGTLYRCLDSVKPIADEIIVCDTGSKDRTVEIAREYTDQVYEIPWDDDFASARNRGVERATKDWVLWIDADEHLIGAENLPKYLRENMYRGYVVRQHHHAIDAQFKPDVPVRLFRNGMGIRFYGCVHEHPETGLNEGVKPAVILSDVHIMHDGYVTEAVRRGRFLRNLPMLLKDRKRHPERRLGLVFLARDYIHLARYEMERTHGVLTERARKHLWRAVAIHREHFKSPDDALYAYSFPLYQQALGLLGVGFEVGYFVVVGDELEAGDMLLPYEQLRRVRVADEEDAREYLSRHVGELLDEARIEEEFPFEDVA